MQQGAPSFVPRQTNPSSFPILRLGAFSGLRLGEGPRPFDLARIPGPVRLLLHYLLYVKHIDFMIGFPRDPGENFEPKRDSWPRVALTSIPLGHLSIGAFIGALHVAIISECIVVGIFAGSALGPHRTTVVHSNLGHGMRRKARVRGRFPPITMTIHTTPYGVSPSSRQGRHAQGRMIAPTWRKHITYTHIITAYT